MKIKIEIDDYEIIDSGSIIIDGNRILKFSFPENNLNFKVKFSDDPNVEYPKFDTKVYEEENYLEINIINSNQGQLLGNVGLASLATLNNRQLYFKFRVTNSSDETSDRVFHYSWYLKNEENGSK